MRRSDASTDVAAFACFVSSTIPQQIVNVFDWDRSGIEAFMADPEVPEVMRAAGLQGPPEFTFVEQVEELEA